MAENFQNLKKSRYPNTESTEGPKQDKHKQTYTKTYYNRNSKSQKILKAAREKKKKKEFITRKPTIRLFSDFSIEMLWAGKEWQNTFKVLKGKDLQPRILWGIIISNRRNKEFLRQAETKNSNIKLILNY